MHGREGVIVKDRRFSGARPFFGAPAFRSKPFSTTWRAEIHSMNFWMISRP